MARETIVNIARVENLYIGVPQPQGFEPETASDLSVATGGAQVNAEPDIIATRSTAAYSGLQMTLQEELEHIEAQMDLDQVRAEQYVPVEERIDPETRQAHLYKLIQTVAKTRKIRGAITTHEETGLKDLPGAKRANKRYKDSLTKSLAQACGHCAFKGNCVLEDNPELWMRKHPAKGKVANKTTQESIARFQEDLDREPMAHCMPTRNRYHKMRKDVLPKTEL